MQSHNNLIALVTGSSRGIGKSIAIELGKQGITVLGTATTESGAERITDYLTENNIHGQGFVLDISNHDSVNDLLMNITDKYGAPNILVNNAGITSDNLFLRMKEDEWDNVINTNLSGVFRLAKACIRPMIKAKWGRIVNISSVVATTGNPGQTNYSAAKAGLLGFSKSLAKEVSSRGVTVNVVSPGFIDTDMTKKLTEEQRQELIKQIPAGRIGQPEDIAQVVNFLISDGASYITGETLHVNGGMLMA